MWGAYYAVLIICEKLFLQKWLDKIPRFFQWLYAFVAVVIGWVMKICLTQMPEYTDISEGHKSACWLLQKEQFENAKEGDK